MTDAEIMKGVKLCNGDLGNCKECPFDSIGKTCGIELAKAEIGLIERLQAENAALKERLERAVVNGKRFIVEKQIDGREVYVVCRYKVIKSYICTEYTREAAEAKLAELEEKVNEETDKS